MSDCGSIHTNFAVGRHQRNRLDNMSYTNLPYLASYSFFQLVHIMIAKDYERPVLSLPQTLAEIAVSSFLLEILHELSDHSVIKKSLHSKFCCKRSKYDSTGTPEPSARVLMLAGRLKEFPKRVVRHKVITICRVLMCKLEHKR